MINKGVTSDGKKSEIVFIILHNDRMTSKVKWKICEKLIKMTKWLRRILDGKRMEDDEQW